MLLILDADLADAENNVTSLEIVVANVNDGAAEVVTIAGQTVTPIPTKLFLALPSVVRR